MSKKAKLVAVYTRLYSEDAELLRKMAAERGTPLAIELRMLVHRTLRGEKREVVLVKGPA